MQLINSWHIHSFSVNLPAFVVGVFLLPSQVDFHLFVVLLQNLGLNPKSVCRVDRELHHLVGLGIQ